jgi:hypothetical protein
VLAPPILLRALSTRFSPELARGLERIDADILPPQIFASRAVEFAVMAAAAL